MKKALLTIVEPTRATLLIVLAIGLGIEVHPVFFVVVLAIAMAVLAQAIVNALAHRHP
jgi:hypothetical protein